MTTRIGINGFASTDLEVVIESTGKVLFDSFGIERGFMTTIHAYTNDQHVLDGPHKDPRRARAAADPVVSSDVIGDSASCVFDAQLTQASGRLVKGFGWYDNEWGYTARLVDLTRVVANQLESSE